MIMTELISTAKDVPLTTLDKMVIRLKTEKSGFAIELSSLKINKEDFQ